MSRSFAEAMPRRATTAIAMAIALAACRKNETAASAPRAADAAVEAPRVEPTADAGASPSAGLAWAEAIRAEQWKEAELAIARLSLTEQGKPEVRLARAEVFLALDKPAPALPLLEKLDDELPLLRDLVMKMRATAALRTGPFDKAAEWFASRSTPSAWLKAAEAWERANDVAKARIQCDRVITSEKRTAAHEEKARAMRFRIVRANQGPASARGGDQGDAAVASDARWLAIHALDEAVADTANGLLAKLTKPLDSREMLARARTLSDAGFSEQALRVLEKAAGTKGASAQADVCHTRAEAYYRDRSRARYVDAALAYRACSASGGPRAAEDGFLSARSFTRADRDADALPAFAAVVQKFPKTVWSDQAEFHIARIHALSGRFREAAHAFDEHLKHHPRSKERSESERYRALSHLLAGNAKIARKHLEDLVGSTAEGEMRARWTNLAALAALKDGDRLHAIARWQEVARSEPLSWPALVARARLAALSAAIPEPIATTEPSTAPQLPIELPPPVDLLHRVGLDSAAEEALREHEASVVAKGHARPTEALCDTYEPLDRGKRRYQVARQVPSVLLSTAPGPKNRWAWDCVFPRPFRNQVRTNAQKTKLPPALLWAVMRQESSFDPEVVSPARAIGLLQLLPETGRAVATSMNAPFDDGTLFRSTSNIMLGAAYLKELLDKMNGDTALAVAAYNVGPEAIVRWRERLAGVPLDAFVETIPSLETRGYVVRVMSNFARYAFLEGGAAAIPQIALESN